MLLVLRTFLRKKIKEFSSFDLRVLNINIGNSEVIQHKNISFVINYFENHIY